MSLEEVMLNKVSQAMKDKDCVFCSYVEAKASFCLLNH